MTKSNLSKVGAIALLSFTFASASAGTVSCATSGGAPYCAYTGKVVKAYVNANDQILLYLDTSFTPSQISAVGLSGVTAYNAVVRRISTNPEFAKMLYSTLLTAKASGVTVSVQMYGVSGGYLEMNKIWINEQ